MEHVVLLSSNSVLFPDAESNPIARQHMVAERAVAEAGLDWTFVRPAYFATNTLRWQSIRTERVLRTAFPEAATPLVHERDIQVPAEVATDATPEVLGRPALSYAEWARDHAADFR